MTHLNISGIERLYLEIDFEPDRGEHLTCFPFAEINNLDDPPTISLIDNLEENA